jgi:predicted ArsR family transcriptional regulator
VVEFLGRQPGSTVADLASHLGVSGTAVRRHLDSLSQAGVVRPVPGPRPTHGRPASGWELTAQGGEVLPRSYDRLALDLLDSVVDELGSDALAAVLERHATKLAAEYAMALAGAESLGDQVKTVARLRDADGYLAGCEPDDCGGWRLVEHNCAVQRAAERHPAICAMELSLLRQVLGAGVKVERSDHVLSGDPCCCYRIRPLN